MIPTSGPSPSENPGEFGQGLRRIHVVVDFLCAFRDQDAEAMKRLLHPEVVVGSFVGIVPAHGYSGREAAIGYFAEARRQGVQIEPEASAISVEESGGVLGEGSFRIAMAGNTDEAPAAVAYGFRGDLIDSIKGGLVED